METIRIQGRGVIAGVVEGEAMVCPGSITGWNGVEPSTGVITDFTNPHRGETMKGRILVLPGSKGSNGWSCYFGAASVAGTAPAGWMFTKIDSAAGVASSVMNIPTIVDFPEDQDPCQIIRDGDHVRMDGSTGVVEITRKGNGE